MRNEAGPPNVIMPNVKHHRLFWREWWRWTDARKASLRKKDAASSLHTVPQKQWLQPKANKADGKEGREARKKKKNKKQETE